MRQKGKLAEAIRYVLARWEGLNRIVQAHPQSRIDELVPWNWAA